METVAVVLILLLAVVVSSSLARMSPLPIPVPLVQILLGAGLSAVANLGVELKPEIFFVLFLPPLLFLDGWRVSKEGLLRDKAIILELALGLVIFTVLGLGFFMDRLIPGMPLAVAFALAAIVSPTDPIAVSAIAARVPIPNRLMHILEGESLLNDASGLVSMRFAVAAAMTGTFSATEAIATFLWLAIGGVAVGVAVTVATDYAKHWISRRFGEEAGSQILLSLLIPFGAYLIAEQIHCSGILAAVSAGVAMSYAEQAGQALASTRVRRADVWDTVQFAANGVIFVLLGEQLPQIVSRAAEVVRDTGHHEPAWLIVYVLVISIALALLRSVWVWATLQFVLYRSARRGQRINAPSWRLVAATSLAGVRGAVTLAGVLTLPLALPDGAPFPARDLAIFLAAGVIIVSLVAASLGLPTVLKGIELPGEPSHQEAEDRTRVAAGEAAIRAIERAQHDMGEGRSDADLYVEIGARVMETYRRKIDGRSKTGDEATEVRKGERIERDLRLAALRAEREVVYHAARRRELDQETARHVVREIDLQEERLTAR